MGHFPRVEYNGANLTLFAGAHFGFASLDAGGTGLTVASGSFGSSSDAQAEWTD